MSFLLIIYILSEVIPNNRIHTAMRNKHPSNTNENPSKLPVRVTSPVCTTNLFYQNIQMYIRLHILIK